MTCQCLYTLNALTLLRAHADPAYARVLARADLNVADGIGAVWAFQRLTRKPVERTTGIDLAIDLVSICAREQQRVFLLGGKPGVASAAAAKLQDQFPGLEIAGCRDGYWLPAGEAAVVEQVNQSRADLLLVALGQPAQEFFIDRHRQELAVRLAMGVGGSFDVWSGHLRRSPQWMRRAGLEWLFRFLQQPQRLVLVWPLCCFVWWILWWRPGGKSRQP